VTEDFCETLHKNKSEMLSKNQERIPAPQPKKDTPSNRVVYLFLPDVGCFVRCPTTRALWDGVRIFRPQVEKLAFQAQDGISFP